MSCARVPLDGSSGLILLQTVQGRGKNCLFNYSLMPGVEVGPEEQFKKNQPVYIKESLLGQQEEWGSRFHAATEQPCSRYAAGQAL